MNKTQKIKESLLIEKNFADQIERKISSALNMFQIFTKNEEEVRSFLEMLKELTNQNIEILEKMLPISHLEELIKKNARRK
jgi:hypothetical protein